MAVPYKNSSDAFLFGAPTSSIYRIVLLLGDDDLLPNFIGYEYFNMNLERCQFQT
jgi:hypothetical protein